MTRKQQWNKLAWTAVAVVVMWLVVRIPPARAALPTADVVQPEVVGRSETAVLDSYLRTEFCAGGLCAPGAWARWIVVDESAQWTVDELRLVAESLRDTLSALRLLGLEGEALLAGYRFRRYHGDYVDNVQGHIAVVRHNRAEIVLADAAFTRHRGFNIYHELGHIVDARTNRALSHAFHAQVGSGPGGHLTADGYWLREHGRNHRTEATADAFALWVCWDFVGLRRPVFAGTRTDTDYAGIVAAMRAALIAQRV